jgi:hypothetical protein
MDNTTNKENNITIKTNTISKARHSRTLIKVELFTFFKI